MGSPDSPYPVGDLVTDPRLLQHRHNEIAAALEAVAHLDGAHNRHAVVLGDPRSGRSSVLHEVARRAESERRRLVVWLRGCEQLAEDARYLTRHLLTATVEALVAKANAVAEPWYLAWRDRVYLRRRTPATVHDLLSSALVLAADEDATIDRAVLERDLRLLRDLAQEAGCHGILLCIDDASPLTADIDLIEGLLSLA